MKYNINKITEFAIYLIFDTYFIDNSGLVSFNSRSFINTFAKSLLPRSLELYYKY